MGERLIIGFGYRRHSGKDTCCTMAKDILFGLGHPARVDHFADSIKEGIGRGVFGFDNYQLYGDGKEEVDPFWGFTPRFAFTRFGTEVMHTLFGKDIWVKTLIRRARADKPGVHLLIGDVRFPAEIEVVRELGGLLVHVDRPGLPRIDSHASETALDSFDGWDHTIYNRGTLEDLRAAVHWLILSLRREGRLSGPGQQL